MPEELTLIQKKIALSAQPCGCDPGAKWVCSEHFASGFKIVEFEREGYSAKVVMREIVKLVAGTAAPSRASTLPTGGKERKGYPVASGVLDYFPDALVAVAAVSYAGNEQHNPGQPLHWAREKSTDQSDTMIRHFLQRGSLDIDGQRHSAKMVWRALAILQLEIEAEIK
jgi:hypothetical protein